MFCAQDYGIATGHKLRVAAKKCMAWSCFSVKKKCLWAQNVVEVQKKHLDEILPLIKGQPLLREIVIVYIVKDLSKKEIYYVIYSYQPNFKTRRYNSSTKSSHLWSLRIQDSKSLPNNFSSNYAHPRFDLERLNKSRSKTTTLEAVKEKGQKSWE